MRSTGSSRSRQSVIPAAAVSGTSGPTFPMWHARWSSCSRVVIRSDRSPRSIWPVTGMQTARKWPRRSSEWLRAELVGSHGVSAFPWWLLTLTSPFVATFREMRYLWREPVRMDKARFIAALGQEPHTPLDERSRLPWSGLVASPRPQAPKPKRSLRRRRVGSSMKRQINSWAAWILVRIHFVTANFDPEVLQWPCVTTRSFWSVGTGGSAAL